MNRLEKIKHNSKKVGLTFWYVVKILSASLYRNFLIRIHVILTRELLGLLTLNVGKLWQTGKVVKETASTEIMRHVDESSTMLKKTEHQTSNEDAGDGEYGYKEIRMGVFIAWLLFAGLCFESFYTAKLIFSWDLYDFWSLITSTALDSIVSSSVLSIVLFIFMVPSLQPYYQYKLENKLKPRDVMMVIIKKPHWFLKSLSELKEIKKDLNNEHGAINE